MLIYTPRGCGQSRRRVAREAFEPRRATRSALAARSRDRVVGRALLSDLRHSSNLSLSSYDPLQTRQLAQAHRTTRVQLLGRDADLAAESQLAAVNKPRRGVHQDGRGVDSSDPRG